MGNCIQPDATYLEPVKVQGQNGMIRCTTNSLLSRFEAVEGTLFLYRSMILRNCLNVQREVSKLIEKQKTSLASFALKRQKLYEALLREIEEHMDGLREATRNIEVSKKKKECLKVLSATYTLIQDIGDLVKLEDVFQGEDGVEKSKEGFDTLFQKYEINTEEIQEMIFRMDPQFNGITLTESTCIKRSDLPHFESEKEIPIACESVS